MSSRLALGFVSAVFLAAGAAKLLDPEAFAFSIEAYRLTPWMLSVALALYLPCLEILAAVALWVPRLRRGALLLLLALCTLFLAVLGSALARDLPITCGCLGPGALPGGLWGSIALDLCLALTILYALTRQPASRDRLPQVPRTVLFR